MPKEGAGSHTQDAVATGELTPLARASAPHISLTETIAGRDTLAAIAEELAPERSMGREPIDTVNYGDRLSGAPGAPVPAIARYLDAGPHISIRSTLAGRDTLAAIDQELGVDHVDAVPETLEFVEVLTFVVRGAQAEQLMSQAARERIVAERLLARLPVESMSGVERVDASPWGRGAVLLRVWCKLST